MDYRPPSFRQPTQYAAQGGLDSLFQAYVAAQEKEKQDAMQDVSIRSQYGGERPDLMTPEARARSLAGPTVTPALPGTPAIPPSPNPQAFMSQIGQTQTGPLMASAQGQDPYAASRAMMGNPGQEATPGIPEHIQYSNDLHEEHIQRAIRQKQVGVDLGNRHTEAEIYHLTQGQPLSNYSIDQAVPLLTPAGGDREKTKADLLRTFPNGVIPKDYAHMSAANMRFEGTMGEKESQFNQRRLDSMGESLDPSKARGGAFSVSKNVFDQAERLESMSNAAKGNPDKRQMEELAIGINKMLSGSSSPAQQQVSALIPQSLSGDVNKLREWLVNEPTGTGQQEFVKRLSDTVAREKATASDQMKRTQFSRAARMSDLEKSSPDAFYNKLESYGLDPEEYKSWRKNGSKPLSAVQGAEGLKAPGEAIFGTPAGTFKSGAYTVTVHP